MATNRDLLKQAIADAKTVKETAIANATAVLEESFAPYLREKLAAKLAEIDSMDEEMEDEGMEENKALDASKRETGYNKLANDRTMKTKHFRRLGETEDMEESDGYTEKSKRQAMSSDHYHTMEEEMEDEGMEDEGMYENETGNMDNELEELLRELDMDMEETINDPKGSGSHGNVAPSSGTNDTDLMEAKKAEGEDDEDEEINIEDMSEEDLKEFIENVIHDMIEDGELEAGHEGMENEKGEESEEGEEDELAELLGNLEKNTGYTEKSKRQAMSSDHYHTMEEEMDEMKNELDEAYKTLAKVRADLNEVNLLNSKLLYTNKIFKTKNLTDSQKVKVLEAFDKATSKKEAKLVYETVIENLNTTSKPSITESVKGMASKVIASNTPRVKQPIIEVNSAFARMQKLAGITK
jgi:hypothetical protein